MEGEILAHPLAALTSWHVGGAADRFYMPSTLEGLGTYLQNLPPTLPIEWLGLGSNVLIRVLIRNHRFSYTIPF